MTDADYDKLNEYCIKNRYKLWTVYAGLNKVKYKDIEVLIYEFAVPPNTKYRITAWNNSDRSIFKFKDVCVPNIKAAMNLINIVIVQNI